MARTLEDSVRDGDAYRLTGLSADIDAGDTVLLVKNTGTRVFKVAQIIINGGNATSLYDIHFLDTASTAPAGTAVLAVPLNGRKDNGYGTTALIAKNDETGYTQGTILEEAAVLATTRVVVDMHDMALGNNQAIAIDQITESTAGGVTVVGFFE